MEKLGQTQSTWHRHKQFEGVRNSCCGKKIDSGFCKTYKTVFEMKTSPAGRSKHNMSDGGIGTHCTSELLLYPA